MTRLVKISISCCKFLYVDFEAVTDDITVVMVTADGAGTVPAAGSCEGGGGGREHAQRTTAAA